MTMVVMMVEGVGLQPGRQAFAARRRALRRALEQIVRREPAVHHPRTVQQMPPLRSTTAFSMAPERVLDRLII